MFLYSHCQVKPSQLGTSRPPAPKTPIQCAPAAQANDLAWGWKAIIASLQQFLLWPLKYKWREMLAWTHDILKIENRIRNIAKVRCCSKTGCSFLIANVGRHDTMVWVLVRLLSVVQAWWSLSKLKTSPLYMSSQNHRNGKQFFVHETSRLGRTSIILVGSQFIGFFVLSDACVILCHPYTLVVGTPSAETHRFVAQ